METPPLSPEPAPLSPVPPPASPGITPLQWAVILHLSGLVGVFIPTIGNILAPLVIWMVKKETVPSLDQVGKDVLNFQISYTIYMWVAGLSSAFCLSWLIVPPIAVLWLVFLIVGAVKAGNGERFDFPLTIKLL